MGNKSSVEQIEKPYVRLKRRDDKEVTFTSYPPKDLQRADDPGNPVDNATPGPREKSDEVKKQLTTVIGEAILNRMFSNKGLYEVASKERIVPGTEILEREFFAKSADLTAIARNLLRGQAAVKEDRFSAHVNAKKKSPCSKTEETFEDDMQHNYMKDGGSSMHNAVSQFSLPSIDMSDQLNDDQNIQETEQFQTEEQSFQDQDDKEQDIATTASMKNGENADGQKAWHANSESNENIEDVLMNQNSPLSSGSKTKEDLNNPNPSYIGFEKSKNGQSVKTHDDNRQQSIKEPDGKNQLAHHPPDDEAKAVELSDDEHDGHFLECEEEEAGFEMLQQDEGKQEADDSKRMVRMNGLKMEELLNMEKYWGSRIWDALTDYSSSAKSMATPSWLSRAWSSFSSRESVVTQKSVTEWLSNIASGIQVKNLIPSPSVGLQPLPTNNPSENSSKEESSAQSVNVTLIKSRNSCAARYSHRRSHRAAAWDAFLRNLYQV